MKNTMGNNYKWIYPRIQKGKYLGKLPQHQASRHRLKHLGPLS